MGKIVYSYYTPADAPAVTELFRRNAFGMGKYDPELTPERFIQNQEKKGFVFGIVGHDGGTAVTYVACYRNGSQRVCRAGQLIIGVMLIDKKFRSAMFSIADMFRMLLDRAENEGYLVLISEVATTNTSSLLLNRKTGALIFEAKPTVYGDYVLYDYMPSMLRHVCSHNVIETNIMPMLLRRISKAELLRETPVDGSGCFIMSWKANGYEYLFTVERSSSLIVGTAIDNVFRLNQSLRNRSAFTYCAEAAEAGHFTVRYEMPDGSEKTQTLTCPVGKTLKLTAPTGCVNARFDIDGQLCTYRYDVQAPVRKKMKLRELGNDILFNETTGYLSFGRTDAPALTVIWPCFTYPYLEGWVVPNESKTIRYEFVSRRQFFAELTVDGVAIRRNYHFPDEQTAEIETRVTNPEKKPLDPLFQLAVPQSGSRVTVYLQDGTSFSKESGDPADSMYPELPFNDYQNLPYSGKPLERIEIETPSGTYAIRSEHPATCFFHRNYLRLRPEAEARDGTLCFGKITIRRLRA